MAPPPVTPDGRYTVVRGRLWRLADPRLSPDERQAHVDALMTARRSVRAALAGPDASALATARAAVDAAKVALGERGPVWWEGDEDLNRHLAKTTRYAARYASLGPQE